MHRARLLLALPLFASCAALGPASAIIDTETLERIDVEELADRLEDAQVVFLGELHDNDTAHDLQLAVCEALLARHGRLTISLEMFERDVQFTLDRYLLGMIDEPTFLAASRPWSNYREHYRPVIELARANGLRVLAANAPRPLASKLAMGGRAEVAGHPHIATNVWATEGEYRDRFFEVMSGMPSHGGHMTVEGMYLSQSAKDDTMAESIANHLAEFGADAPPVVHLCGRFHSDYGLGTVERLLRRRPDLDVAVVSTVAEGGTARELTEDERSLGDFVWLVH